MQICLSLSFSPSQKPLHFSFSSPHHFPNPPLLKCQFNSHLLCETLKSNSILLPQHPEKIDKTMKSVINTKFSHIFTKSVPFLWLKFCFLSVACFFPFYLHVQILFSFFLAHIPTCTRSTHRSLESTVILLLLKSYHFYPSIYPARFQKAQFQWLINRYSAEKKKKKVFYGHKKQIGKFLARLSVLPVISDALHFHVFMSDNLNNWILMYIEM